MELDIPDLREFITAQTADNEFRPAATTVAQPKTLFSYAVDGVLVSVSPVDGASQRYLPAVLRPHVLRLCHYLLMEGHPDERQMYDSMRREFY